MFIASVVKCIFLRRPHALINFALPCFARAGGSTESLHCRIAMTASVISKSSGLNFRTFSSTCATGFRTANSFTSYANNDEPETPGKGTIKVKTGLLATCCT